MTTRRRKFQSLKQQLYPTWAGNGSGDRILCHRNIINPKASLSPTTHKQENGFPLSALNAYKCRSPELQWWSHTSQQQKQVPPIPIGQVTPSLTTEFMLSELWSFGLSRIRPVRLPGARNDHQLVQIHHTVLRILQVQGSLCHKIHVTFSYRCSCYRLANWLLSTCVVTDHQLSSSSTRRSRKTSLSLLCLSHSLRNSSWHRDFVHTSYCTVLHSNKPVEREGCLQSLKPPSPCQETLSNELHHSFSHVDGDHLGENRKVNFCKSTPELTQQLH